MNLFRISPAQRWAGQIASHEANAAREECYARLLARLGLKPWAWDAQDRATGYRITAARMRTCPHRPSGGAR